jgi:rubrerythrin
LNRTRYNIESAFSGESKANRKYLFFADKAEVEGEKRIARLFRAAADAETVHARNHLKVMHGIKSTSENLATAMDGENHEFTEMYPAFIKQAKEEGQSKAVESFDLANQVEKIHHDLYQEALNKLERGEPSELRPFYVCQRCGNTVEGEAPEKCPICGASNKMFKLIE